MADVAFPAPPPEPSTPADDADFEAALAAARAASHGPAVAAAPPAPEPAPVVVEPAPAPAPEVKPPVGLDQVLALEAQARERLTALEQRQADVAAAERALVERHQEMERQRALFARDPVGYAKSIAPDLTPGQLAEMFYMAELGDKAPPEAKARAYSVENYRELQAANERIAALEQRILGAESERKVADYRAGLRTHAPSEAEHPILANLAKRNAARYEEVLFAEAQRAAYESKGQVVLTPAQAAATAEARLRAQRDDLYGPPPAPTPAPTAPAPIPQTTVFDKSTAAAVPPKGPPADPLDDDELTRQALEAIGKPHLFESLRKNK